MLMASLHPRAHALCSAGGAFIALPHVALPPKEQFGITARSDAMTNNDDVEEIGLLERLSYGGEVSRSGGFSLIAYSTTRFGLW